MAFFIELINWNWKRCGYDYLLKGTYQYILAVSWKKKRMEK